ncbi:MAG: DUF2029 domain-containing protein [Sphingobacteriales bacterium]|nr:MAG: DUF2029 domain-containing protein [Sphingobacteriales bacterium]
MQKLKSFLFNYRTLFFIYVAITIIAAIQLISIDQNNNFYIFRASSQHLLKGLPLYTTYPAEYFDYFYYNPVFAVLFMPFSFIPLYPSLVLWLFTISLGVFFIFKKLPLPGDRAKAFMLLIVFDLHNNLNHTQTNPFVLAFMLMVWVLMEKEKFFWAAMFGVLCFLIKGYGGIICLVCLFYKGWYKMIFYGLFWLLAFNSLLLLFMTPGRMVEYYREWLEVISGGGILESYSIYGVLKNLHLAIPEKFILMGAVAILALFLGMQALTKVRNKAHIVAFLLIWVIAFNRAAESATYIIAMGGCILWYLSRPANRLSTILFWVTILVASIIPTHISRAFDDLRYEYYLKCVFSLLILVDILVYTAMHMRKESPELKPAQTW